MYIKSSNFIINQKCSNLDFNFFELDLTFLNQSLKNIQYIGLQIIEFKYTFLINLVPNLIVSNINSHNIWTIDNILGGFFFEDDKFSKKDLAKIKLLTH